MLTNLEGEKVVIPELVAIAWNLCEAEASDTAGSCLGSVNPDLEKQDKYQNDLANTRSRQPLYQSLVYL